MAVVAEYDPDDSIFIITSVISKDGWSSVIAWNLVRPEVSVAITVNSSVARIGIGVVTRGATPDKRVAYLH